LRASVARLRAYTLAMTTLFDVLAPPPCELHVQPEVFALPARLGARGPELALRQLRRQLTDTEWIVANDEREPALHFELSDADSTSEAYRITAAAGRLRVDAEGPRAAFYAAVTLGQLLRRLQPGEALPEFQLRDEPGFAVRGFMLDISRDRVPTMASLELLIERLAQLKFNQLQLYMEHTFAYAGHETVWKSASALTPAEVRQLDAFCRERQIELVPNQNCFGHMHRWLVHEPYRQLAEVPEGVEHAFSLSKEPFSLAPEHPDTLPLVADLLDQLLPCFESSMVNVGLDETFDLGTGASRAACATRGKGRVYLDYLQRVADLVRERGATMQFWGDIIVRYPELVAELPSDAIALEWGYEAGHPFPEHAQRFAASGLRYYVCPGTSSWQSISGRLHNARGNLAEAARVGRAEGALGYLVTDWGDFGHWQQQPISWPGILLGASYAWNAEREVAVEQALGALFFDDPDAPAARTLLRLSNLDQVADVSAVNGSPLFFFLRQAGADWPTERVKGLTPTCIERLAAELDGLQPQPAIPRTPDGDTVARELAWTVECLRWACDFAALRERTGAGQPLAAAPRPERVLLAERLSGVMAGYNELWALRSRSGGRADSVGRFAFIESLLHA